MKKIKYLLFLLALITSLFLTCHQKTPQISPGNIKSIEIELNSLKTEADREFRKMYWAGWKNAIPLYEKALKIREDRNIQEKLFCSLLLIAIREKNFQIRNLNYIRRAEQILPYLENNNIYKIYLNLAKELVNSPGLSEKFDTQSRVEIKNKSTITNLESLKARIQSDYHFYFYLRYFEHYLKNKNFKAYNSERERFKKSFPNSNLKLEIDGGTAEINKTLENYPDFIEMVLFQAGLLCKSGFYKQAESRYQFVLEINPHVPEAFTEIGSIYFWLELYDKAMENYSQALATNPHFSKALFGMAMCKHYTNEFECSNNILKELIASQTFYHGETYYFMALNHYYLKNQNIVETNIKKAMMYIPDSTDLNAFAGMFFYHQNNLNKAEFHLKKVFEHKVPHGDAHFYTGLIAIKRKKPAIKNFLSAATCYLMEIQNKEAQIKQVKSLNIGEDYKNRIIKKRKKNLINTAKVSKERLYKISKIYINNSSVKTIKNILNKINRYYLLYNQSDPKPKQ